MELSFFGGSGGSTTPPKVQCEARVPTKGVKMPCVHVASYVYGPECEAETGKLMYICESHALALRLWMEAHPNDPVECPTHGNIGPVKNYVILRKM